MDPMYDIELAKRQLEVAIDNFNKQNNCLNAIDAVKMADLSVIYIESPQSWRIVKMNDEGRIIEGSMDFEEEMFNIHGVLCAHDLPPVKTKNLDHLKKKAKFIRQAIRITGFDLSYFRETISKVNDIHVLMHSSANPVEVAAWAPTTYEGYSAMDINARYFTPRKNSPYERGQAFGLGVDPTGILAEIRGQELIHGNDNKVEYLKEYKEEQGKTKREPILPSEFNTGDIVRATVSFVTFPTREGKAQMTVILRALTLIESFKNKSNQTQPMKHIHKSSTIKRRAIFDEEKDTRERFTRMTIDEEEAEGS